MLEDTKHKTGEEMPKTSLSWVERREVLSKASFADLAEAALMKMRSAGGVNVRKDRNLTESEEYALTTSLQSATPKIC